MLIKMKYQLNILQSFNPDKYVKELTKQLDNIQLSFEDIKYDEFETSKDSIKKLGCFL